METTHSLPIERHQLGNGLRIVLQPDRELPLVAVNLWYHVGSKNESLGSTGFAHLFEHMLFQGSQHVETNGHFGHLQRVGGVANGSTSRDRTNYYETLPSNHLDLGLWLESDRMGFLLPAMTPEKLENQRQVVMNERRQNVDNQPYGLAHERIWELLFPETHPYHWPIIGYMDDIEAATLEEVHQFFESWYRPNNAVLTLAGDFEPAAALDAIERFFGPLPSGPLPDRPKPAEQHASGERRAVLEDNVNLPRVYLSFRAPAYGDPDWYTADLLTTVLGDGKSSPLYDRLVHQRRLAQNANSWIYETEIAGVVTVVGTASPGTEAADLEAALVEQLDEIASSGPSEQDLERAVNRTLTRSYGELQSLAQRADLLSQYTTYFDQPELLGREADRYKALSREDLQAFAARLFRPENRAVVTVIPKADQSPAEAA